MSIRRTRKVATTALIAMALIPATLTAASAAPAPTSEMPTVTVGTQTTNPQKVRDFWTPKRISRALANEKTDQADTARAAAAAAAAAKVTGKTTTKGTSEHLTAQAAQVRPGTKTGTPVLAADSGVPEMPYAQPVSFPESPPAVVVGKIVFYDHEGEEHGCSGASIVADGNNTVWTAGHCVHPGDGSGAEGYYDLIEFIPGYKKNDQAVGGYDAPWGEWVAKMKVAPTAWTADEDFLWGDMAAFTVTPPKGYTNLTSTVGALGYKFGSGPNWSDIIDSGFPGDGYQRTDMDGFTQFYCTGNVEDAGSFNPLDDRLKMDCDMGHGASGGPMATPQGQIVGTNSHGESDDAGNITEPVLYSAAHGDNAVAVINKINELN